MKLLVSACLLGDPVRYDGQAQRLADPSLRVWQQAGMLVPFCPEVAGGLPTPRPAGWWGAGRPPPRHRPSQWGNQARW